MKKANIMQHKKAFTLVELIVVITILAILGTISFISIQNYSKEARDSKRLTDVRSLLTKLSLEQTTSGLPYKKLLITTIPHTVYVGGKPNSEAYQGIVDFELLKESQKNFQDPESNTDYDFATVKGKAEYNGTPQNYDFIQGRYWSEKNNEQVILGNYYQYETGDNEHLFKDTLTGPNESTDTPPITQLGNCDDTSKPTDNGHIEYTPGNPSNQNTPWTQAPSGDCTYQCKDGYTGTDCATYTPPLPDGVTLGNATTGLGCTGTDIIIKKGTTNLTMAGCNSKKMGVGITAYTEQNCIDEGASTASHCQGDYYTWVNAASACPSPRRLPTEDELDKIVTNLGWGSISPMGSPYYLTFAGYRGGTGVGYYGNYWSSTEYNTHYAYSLRVNSSYANVNFNYDKTDALSVRCVKN